MNKLTKPAVRAYQRELRRQGFALRYRERSKHNGNMWVYGKSYATPNRLGTTIEYRDVKVQLSDFGCRVSHMVSPGAAHLLRQGTTTPTGFTTVGEMVLAIALEVSRYDQWRYGIEHHDKNPRSYRPLMWMIDDNNIVRVTTSTLVGPPLVTEPLSPGPVSTPNSKQSQLYAHCDRCKRRRPIDKLAHSGPVHECIDADECYQSQRRQGFINGT